MTHHDLEAALTWDDDLLTSIAGRPPGMSRRVRLGEPADEGFGLLEGGHDGGWTLCIPAGAHAQAAVGEHALDLSRLRLEPSGERRLPLCAGLTARVEMGDFRFEVRPTA